MGSQCFNGDSVLVGGDETVLEMDGGDGGAVVGMYVMPQSSTLKND